MAVELEMEKLDSALSALLRGFSPSTNRAFIDACIACRAPDGVELVEWACERVTQWLVSGPSTEVEA